MPIVSRCLLGFALPLPQGAQSFGGTVAPIGFAISNELLSVLLIKVHPIGLVVRAIATAYLRTLIPPPTEPSQAIQMIRQGIGLIARAVGILDA
jgi:hypothetical protein